MHELKPINMAKPARHTLAVYINCKDCVEILIPCVSKLLWADEIILADASISSDIEQYAQTLPPSVKHYRVKTDDIFLRLKQLLPQIESEYILGVDTDEMFTEELADEIQNALIAPCPYTGFFIPSLDYNYGALWGPGQTFLRIVRKDKVVLPLAKNAHANWSVDGPTALLTNSYSHLNNPKLGMTAVKHFRYGAISASRMSVSDLDRLNLDRLSTIHLLWHGLISLLRINVRFLRTLLSTRNFRFASLCMAYSDILRVIADDVTPTEEWRMRSGITERGNRGYF